VFSCMREIISEEGITALYKGNYPCIVRFWCHCDAVFPVCVGRFWCRGDAVFPGVLVGFGAIVMQYFLVCC